MCELVGKKTRSKKNVLTNEYDHNETNQNPHPAFPGPFGMIL